MTSTALAPPASPFKGLAAYEDTELDALLFFGRDGDTEVIAANLLSSRLTVLYGPAGVGKSSILRAGVARRVRETAPDGLVVVHDSWAGDSVANLWAAVAAALPAADAQGPQVPLADRLAELVEAFGGHLYLVLDQFEEVFTYGGAAALAEELSEVLTRPKLRVNVLLALREDALSELDVFAGRVSDVFANRLPLGRLDRSAGRAALTGPVARLNELLPDRSIEVAPDLVDAVLDEVEVGRVVLGGVVRGASDAPGDGGIEAPYLQLVMQRVWEVEQARGSAVLRRATLDELGGAQAIVRAHLDRAVAALAPAERDVAARIFNQLVTPSGTKVAHSVRDLTEYAGIREDALLPVLASLGADRILRPLDGRFEIFHDVLADAVLAWRTRHEAQRAAERQRAAAHRRQRRLVGLLAAALAGLAAMAGLAFYALTQRDDARDQARRATARRLEAQAGPLIPVAKAEVDPELGLLLAAEAARRSPTPEGLDILRRALLVSHLRAVLPERGVTEAVFAGRRIVVGTAAGSVSVYTADGRKRVRRLTLGSPVAGIEAAAGGGKILTTRRGGPAQLWDVRSGRELERFGETPTLAAFSPDGTLVVTAEGRTVRVWRSDGRELAALSQDDPIRQVAWGPNGMSVVTAGTGPLARVIDARLRLVAEVDQGGVITSAGITPDGRTLFTTGRNGTARLWSLERPGRLVQELGGHRGQVTAGVLSPNGRLLVTTSTGGIGRVWDLRSRSLVTDLIGHTNRVLGAVFSRDGSSVATWSTDRTVLVWDPERGHALADLGGHGDAVTAVSFSASGDAVLSTSADGRARLWRPFDNRLRLLAELDGPPARAVLSRDGSTAAVAVKDAVSILDSATGARVARLATGRVDGLGVSADGGHVAVAVGRAVTVWGVETGAVERTLEAGERITAVALAADGQTVAAGTAGGSILLSGGAVEVELRGPPARVTSLAFSPSGDRIAAGFQGGAVAVWRTEDGRRIYERRHHRSRSAVTSVAFSSAGGRLVSAGGDSQVIVSNAASGGVSQRLRGHFGPVAGAAFSPDGRWVVTAAPGVAGLFDLVNRQRLFFIGGHSGRVLAASFDAVGRRLATIGADGTLRAYACEVCGGVPELLRLAEQRLAGTARTLSPAERRRYLPDQ